MGRLITQPPNYVAVEHVHKGEYRTEDKLLLIRKLATRWYVFYPHDRMHPVRVDGIVEFSTLTDARRAITTLRGLH